MFSVKEGNAKASFYTDEEFFTRYSDLADPTYFRGAFSKHIVYKNKVKIVITKTEEKVS